MWVFIFCVLLPVTGADKTSADWSLGDDSSLHWSYGNFLHALNPDGSVKWNFDAKLPIRTYAEGLNGTIHIIAQPLQGNSTHYALDAMDGSIQWQRTAMAMDVQTAEVRLLTSDSSLYLAYRPCLKANCPIWIEAIDVAGARKWLVSIRGATFVDLGPAGGLLVRVYDYTNGENSVSVLQPEDGTLKWTLQIDGFSHEEFGGWALSNGDVFVVNYVNTQDAPHMGLLRLDGEDGGVLWNVSHSLRQYFNPPGPHTTVRFWPISGPDGEVYVYSDDEGFEGFLAFDFNGKYLRTLPCRVCRHFTQQDCSKEVIFIDTLLQGRDATGKTVPVHAVNVTTYYTYVSALSGTTGNMLWNVSVAGSASVESFGLDGTVFANDAHNHQGVAIRNGSEVWRGQEFGEALAARDGTTYLQSFNYDSHRLSVVGVDENGTEKWNCLATDPAVCTALDVQSSFLV